VDCVYPFIGTNFAAHSYNLKQNAYNITTNTAWVTGVTHNANGITGNGSSGYGDTGFQPSINVSGSTAYQQANYHVFVYNRTASLSANAAWIGAWNTTRIGLFVNSAATGIEVASDGGGQTLILAASFAGHIMGGRSSTLGAVSGFGSTFATTA
jgi:hypothetical protein